MMEEIDNQDFRVWTGGFGEGKREEGRERLGFQGKSQELGFQDLLKFG